MAGPERNYDTMLETLSDLIRFKNKADALTWRDAFENMDVYLQVHAVCACVRVCVCVRACMFRHLPGLLAYKPYAHFSAFLHVFRYAFMHAIPL